MYRQISFHITALIALRLILVSAPAWAEECLPPTPSQSMKITLRDIRIEEAVTEDDFRQVQGVVRTELRRYIHAVEQNPWAPPETRIWRMLVLNRARHQPLPYSRLLIPTEWVRETLLNLSVDLSRRFPSMTQKIRAALTKPTISYQDFIEFCVDGLQAFDRTLTPTQEAALRESMIQGFLHGMPATPPRIPVYRPLRPRDQLTGGGPRLISIGGDALEVDHLLHNTVDYSTASGALNGITAHLNYSSVPNSEVGALQFVQHAPILTRMQEDTNRFIQAVETLKTTDSETAEFLEIWATQAFSNTSSPISFDALRQSMRNENVFYGSSFIQSVRRHYNLSETAYVGTERWDSLRTRVGAWLATQP